MEPAYTQAELPPLLRRESLGAKLRRFFAPFAVVGAVILKFLGQLKFILPILLKTGGSMLLTIGMYATIWGWKWAVGFVLLIFVHECGHLVAAKIFNLPVSAPMFIPFMGAFIALKDAPKNAWMEACVGIGGPLLGSLGALVCHIAGLSMNMPLLVALATSAYFLNLFNLTPVGMLDGGRIVTALSPWLWLLGFGGLAWLAWTHPNVIVWVLLVVSIPRVLSLFRRRSEEEKRYFEVAPARRLIMAVMYFGLITLLVLGIRIAHDQLFDARQRHLDKTETILE
ncbi:MAG: site-2 protease family protein [Verrucomicrobiota bacterium]|nr:site-2 protease family protein [Verrucomicrobiota bacterium]